MSGRAGQPLTCAAGIFLQESFVRLLYSCKLRHFSRVIMEQGYARVLIQELFYTWFSFYKRRRGERVMLMNRNPWMNRRCYPLDDSGNIEYWQMMTHCPFCGCSLIRLLPHFKGGWECCSDFYTLIRPETDRMPSLVSSAYSNRVFLKYPKYGDRRPQYWIHMQNCVACGGPLSSARRPCCRSLIGRS